MSALMVASCRACPWSALGAVARLPDRDLFQERRQREERPSPCSTLPRSLGHRDVCRVAVASGPGHRGTRLWSSVCWVLTRLLRCPFGGAELSGGPVGFP